MNMLRIINFKWHNYSNAFLVGILGAILLGGGTGCVSVPDRAWQDKHFELPYVHDYSIENNIDFTWQDDWLEANSYTYQQRLAGPFSALAASVYGYNLDMDIHTLTDMGFNSATLTRCYGHNLNYTAPPFKRDRVGYTLAVKRVYMGGELKDILFVVVRGTFGRNEWLSNMNMCNTWGNKEHLDLENIPSLHEGFNNASTFVQQAVEKYVQEQQINLSNAKVVVVGHSRGAAVANILGSRLDDGEMLKGVNPSNVFVYTFATPNTVFDQTIPCDTTRYRNIFNVINPEDMVPLVPIAQWNSRRFGVDLLLHNYDELSLWQVWTDDAYNQMKDEFRDMTGYCWWHTPFGTNSTQLVPQILGKVAPTVEDLYSVPEEQRLNDNNTSIHSILETLIYRCMKPRPDEQSASIGGDIKNLTEVYSTVTATPEPSSIWLLKILNCLYERMIFVPDGKNVKDQPGALSVLWRITCMHATQTYIGWMKAGEMYGPESIYQNWDEAQHGWCD